MFKFITDRPFWVNLLVAFSLLLLIGFSLLQGLGFITKHGEQLTVPAVIGKNTNDAIKLLENQGFDVTIQDSVFTDTVPRGTVIKQLPDPNATVKVNRTVYLTVNRFTPPMIEMPKIVGLSLHFALDVLSRNHLLLKDTVYKPDFMKGFVLSQQYNGNEILPGDRIQWGSRITLVIGSGLDETNMVVPDLLGMKYQEVKPLLDSLGIMPSLAPDADVKDTANAFIYKQNPAHFDEDHKLVYIKSGMIMDIWLSKEKKEIKDSLSNNNLPNQ